MSREVKTQLRWDGRILEGTALLGASSLAFRGGVEVDVPFSEMWQVEANAGWLELKTPRGLLLLELGAKADVWKEKIQNPKGLVEKLGVDATKKVVVVGKLDRGLKEDLEASGAKVAKSARGKDFDLAFVAVHTKTDLEGIAKARVLIHDAGAIWIVYAKGSPQPQGSPQAQANAALTERDVLTGGRTRELTDNKQVKIDDVLTAVRFVVPASARKKK